MTLPFFPSHFSPFPLLLHTLPLPLLTHTSSTSFSLSLSFISCFFSYYIFPLFQTRGNVLLYQSLYSPLVRLLPFSLSYTLLSSLIYTLLSSFNIYITFFLPASLPPSLPHSSPHVIKPHHSCLVTAIFSSVVKSSINIVFRFSTTFLSSPTLSTPCSLSLSASFILFFLLSLS